MRWQLNNSQGVVVVPEETQTEEQEIEVTEEEATEETVDETVETEEETTAEETDESTATTDEAKRDTVPLAKYMEERKKRQEYERLVARQQAERDRVDLTRRMEEEGWPAPVAERMATEEVQRRQEIAALKERQIDYDIRDLARSDQFFADAESFRDDIKSLMREKNVTAEEAYMLLRGRARTTEMKTQQEQLNIHRRRSAETKKIATAAPVKPKSPYPLDNDDRKALAELQKAQPDAGWNPEKYWKLMKEE